MEQLTSLLGPGCFESDRIFWKRNCTDGDVETSSTKIRIGPALCWSLLLHFLFVCKFYRFENGSKVKLSQFIGPKFISKAAVMVVILISLPLVILLSIIAMIYKAACLEYIIITEENYAGAMNSLDAFWCVEDSNSKSIINVAGIIELDCPYEFVEKIKEKLNRMYSDDKVSKIFLRRCEKFGFFYWIRSEVNLDDYAKVMDTKLDADNNKLEDLLSHYSEKPLPNGGKGLFEILVTARPLQAKCSTNKQEYGIIFRIHHSLGDGRSLMKLLHHNISDNEKGELFEPLKKGVSYSTEAIKLLKMPESFVEGVIRKPDSSCLHGPSLAGGKLFAWTQNDNLLCLIKDLKEKLGIKFFSILAAALSASLKTYFRQRNEASPENVALVIPMQVHQNDKTKQPSNDISVAVMEIPLQLENNIDSLNEIERRYQSTIKGPQAVTNYYFLKLASLLPSAILKPLLTRKLATLVLSNLPGPATLSVCGAPLREVVFFVPNKAYTGLGITALTYGGVLRMAACADRAILTDSRELNAMLDGMVGEIERLHTLHCSAV